MTLNFNFWVTLSILAVSYLTSKEIILYNEETLVLITFTLFVIFAYINVSDSVADELKDRAAKIQSEFEGFFTVRENVLRLLITYHEKQTVLYKEIHAIFNATKDQIQTIIEKQQKAFEHNLALQVKQKLRAVQAEEARTIQEIQKKVLSDISLEFATDFQNPSIQSKAQEDSIKTLENIVS